MRKFALCPALLVLSVLTSPADGSGLWDRFKATLPTSASEASFVSFPDGSGSRQIGETQYAEGESPVVTTPDEVIYPDANPCCESPGCPVCRGFTCPGTICYRYLKSMWHRMGQKCRACCGNEPQCGATSCCDEAPCCEPPKRGCCCLRLLARCPWRLRLNKLWCKVHGADAQWSDARWTDGPVIEDYRELPGQPAPSNMEPIPSAAPAVDGVQGPTASAQPPASQSWWQSVVQKTRRDWDSLTSLTR